MNKRKLNKAAWETESFICKVLKQAFEILNLSLYRKLEQQQRVIIIAMNVLGKVRFHSTVLVKFHGFSLRNLKSLKQFFLD